MISNGVPPPSPAVALRFSAVSVVSGIPAVSADRGMVVTDVAWAVAESTGATDVMKVAEAASCSTRVVDTIEFTGTAGLEKAVGSGVIVLGFSADPSWADLTFGGKVIVGCTSIPFAASELVDPCAFGQIAFVPRKVKNIPINVSGGTFVP